MVVACLAAKFDDDVRGPRQLSTIYLVVQHIRGGSIQCGIPRYRRQLLDVLFKIVEDYIQLLHAVDFQGRHEFVKEVRAENFCKVLSKEFSVDVVHDCKRQ